MVVHVDGNDLQSIDITDTLTERLGPQERTRRYRRT